MLQKTCVYCDKGFRTGDKRQKYCDRQCYDASRVDPSHIKSCEICGSPFYANFKSRRFCSKECRLKFGWTPKDPSKKSVFICDWCGKEFVTWIYRQPRFCSNQCRSEFAARQPKIKKRKPEIHITKECEYCGQEYKTTTHQVRLRNSRFCSPECMYATMSTEKRGENNPNWTGGTIDQSKYGPNWHRQARRAKKRDGHTCRQCGYKSGGSRILDVHHITPLKSFNGDWKKANKLSNLISLCRSCHIDIEKKRVRCPSI